MLFGGYLLLSQISTNLVEFKDIAIAPLDLETTTDERCDTMNSRILAGTTPDYLNPDKSGIDPSTNSTCGAQYTIWHNILESGAPDTTGPSTQCAFNLAVSPSVVCVMQENGFELYDGQCPSIPGSGYICTQKSTNCATIMARSFTRCEKYLLKDNCLSNYCHGSHLSYECGIDQNNPRAKCELLDNVWCNSSEYCDFDGSNKWCCEDSSGTDYCRIDENVSSDNGNPDGNSDNVTDSCRTI